MHAEGAGPNRWLVTGDRDSADGDEGLLLCIADETIPGEGGSPSAIPQHRFQIDDDAINGCFAVAIAASPAYGSDCDPVELLRRQCALALELLDEDTMGVFWSASDSLMGADYFRPMVSIWLDGGAFPALGLTTLARDEAGSLKSTGLDLLIGQEVAVLPSADMDVRDQARLAVRVIDFLIREGPIQQDQAIDVAGFGPINFQIDANKGRVNLYR